MTSLVSKSPAWTALAQHSETICATALKDILLGDTERLGHCTLKLNGLTLNYALNHVTPETISLLVRLAEQQDVAGWRSRMFAGEKINNTENRAVLHTALRQQNTNPILVDGKDVMPDVIAVRQSIGAFVARVRDGIWKGATGKAISHIVNIGIGGSDLGPRLAVEALALQASGPQVHFVANVDAYELKSLLRRLPAEETLFVIVSKTFTTQETLLNAQSARKWLVAALGEQAVAQHFVAVSVNKTEVEKFGINSAHMFPMWDWVGGRYSVWSAVGLSVALALGTDKFNQMLAGAAMMDDHFRTAPLAQNMPLILGMLAVWNRNFIGTKTLAVLPYSERLRNLSRFLQQLEMESNGKRVTRDGETVDYGTAPVIFGDCGTVGQHSFHQCLHQGTDIVPADMIGISQDDMGEPAHYRALMSNMVAQAGAFAFGQTDAKIPQEIYPGSRPSNIITLDALTPFNFGMLLALYEHKTFVQGIVWNINSFDQPGVELGKKMAKALESAPSAQPTPADMFMAKLLKTL